MSIHHQAAKYGRELSLPEADVVENEPAASYARRVKPKAKYQALEKLKSKWEEKPLHGQYPKRTEEKDVDQDTDPHLAEYNPMCACGICGQFQETVDHLVSGCPELAKT